MQYTTLGTRTGYKVSVLGFGAMRLPMAGDQVDLGKAVPMIHAGFERGINYIDTAVFYCNADSQRAVGVALKGWRDKVIVSTKNHSYGKNDYDQWRKNFEESLAKLDIDCIDIYNLHGLGWQKFRDNVDGPNGSYKWFEKARDEGLIKHICFSFHDEPKALAKLAKTGQFDVVTCQYNLLDQANDEAMGVAKQEGLGVVVMGPVGGGRLGAPSEQLQELIPGAKSVPEVALRFVISNPNVDVALSGMQTKEQVLQNCDVADNAGALTAKENRKITQTIQRFKKLADLYCTGCNYCMPCPHGVDIPWMFNSLNIEMVYGLTENAKKQYDGSTNQAKLCIGCGKCLSKCPQKIDIITKLQEATRRLDDDYGKLAVRLEPGKVARFDRTGRSAEMELAAKLDLVNYSDQNAVASAAFDPGAGLSVAPMTKSVTLKPFERRRVPVTVAGKADPSRPLPVGLQVDVEGDHQVEDHTELWHLAMAAPQGRSALNKAPAVRLQADSQAIKITRDIAATHGAKMRFAWDADALYIKAEIEDDLQYPPTPKVWMPHADRITLDFDFLGLHAKRGDKPPALTWRLMVSPPTADGSCYQWITNQWEGTHEAAKVESRKTSAGANLTIELPWKNVNCRKPKPGDSFALQVTHSSYSRKGKQNYQGRWSPVGGWVVLG